MRHQGRSLDAWHGNSDHAPLALNHAENRSLVDATANDATTVSADVGLSSLNGAKNRLARLFHQVVANQVRHAPRGLVGATDLPFQLLSGDTASSAGHEVNGVEPQVQRCRRLVEDGASGRVQVVAATVARPRPALLSRVLALEDALRASGNERFRHPARNGRAKATSGTPRRRETGAETP